MQASIVPYDLFSLIVVFISFVKCDEDLLILNCVIKYVFIIHELILKENLSFRKKTMRKGGDENA